MHWPLAIDRNRAALLAVAAAILALIGEGGPVARLVRSAALALLRPAESAVRRLIVIAARGLAVAPRSPRPFIPNPGLVEGSKDGVDGLAAVSSRPPAFPLFDRRKRFGRQLRIVPPPRGIPRIRSFWGPPSAQPIGPSAASVAVAPTAANARTDQNALVDISRLRLRLGSLQRALADLAGQARRLARWRARREASSDHRLRSPLRIGHPPGYRQRARRDIDHALRDCHALALEALASNTC